jgi:hypothetical protein
MMMRLAVCCVLGFAAVAMAADDAEMPEIFTETFEDGAGSWTPTDKSAWKLTEIEEGNKVFDLIKKKSDYAPPHRSPHNIALKQGPEVSSFVLDVDVRSTSRPYDHRSLCLFFNYEDPSHFYYVHLGQKADPHANQIFIVNDAPRTKISTKTTDGTPWDDEWHHVRVKRDAESGLIQVFFDDMETPVMEATDKTFTSGTVGIGSFDDPGQFDNVKLRGKVVDDR